jgi:hypothetical protein
MVKSIVYDGNKIGSTIISSCKSEQDQTPKPRNGQRTRGRGGEVRSGVPRENYTGSGDGRVTVVALRRSQLAVPPHAVDSSAASTACVASSALGFACHSNCFLSRGCVVDFIYGPYVKGKGRHELKLKWAWHNRTPIFYFDRFLSQYESFQHG